MPSAELNVLIPAVRLELVSEPTLEPTDTPLPVRMSTVKLSGMEPPGDPNPNLIATDASV